jgi:hypothetical protein
MIKRIRSVIRNFFFPPHGCPRWMMVLPYAALGVLAFVVLAGGAYGWDYTNSSVCFVAQAATRCLLSMPPTGFRLMRASHA